MKRQFILALTSWAAALEMMASKSDHLTAAFSRSDCNSLSFWYRQHRPHHVNPSRSTTTSEQCSLHPMTSFRSSKTNDRCALTKLGNSAQTDRDGNIDIAASSGGVYVDLGTIAPFNDDIISIVDMDTTSNSGTTITSSIEEWRSKHWIVLIDDESPIRLAIGDYLHSMGYSIITACDGPMAFLEIILWSCSWSMHSMDGEEVEGVATTRQSYPPWIEGGHRPWRLPNCIISDIRMPGGIDGVQLLELLRRCSPMDATVIGPPEKTKRRGRPKKINNSKERGYYDEKDEFELLDAIVEGKSNIPADKIITPVDQAMKYIEAIRERLAYFHQKGYSGQSLNVNATNYPTSLEQIPVILLTAKAMASDRIEGYRVGANGYLPKPFLPEELLAIVDNLMRRQERERKNFINTQSSCFTPEEAKAIALDLAEIRGLITERLGQQQETDTKHHEKLQSLLPEAMWMLRTGERRKRVFTKDHIRSILSLQFGLHLPRNNTNASWEDMMKLLEEQHEDIS